MVETQLEETLGSAFSPIVPPLSLSLCHVRVERLQCELSNAEVQCTRLRRPAGGWYLWETSTAHELFSILYQ